MTAELQDQLVRQGFGPTADTIEHMEAQQVLLVVVFRSGNTMSGIFDRHNGERIHREALLSSTVSKAELREIHQ